MRCGDTGNSSRVWLSSSCAGWVPDGCVLPHASPRRAATTRETVMEKPPVMMMRPRAARRRAIGLGACGADGVGDGITNPVPCSANPVALSQTDVTITLDPTQRFQTIHGFGTTQRLFDDPHITETFNPATARAAIIPPATDQARILDALYRDLRL